MALKNQEFIMSGIHIQLWEPPKKSHFWPFTFLLVPRIEKVLHEEGLSVLSHSFPQLILVLQLYSSIHFNDNFSLTVGNLQHIGLVSLWFYQKILVKGLVYMAELLMPIPYLPPGNWSIALSYPCLSYWRSHNEDQPLEKLSSVASKLSLIQV